MGEEGGNEWLKPRLDGAFEHATLTTSSRGQVYVEMRGVNCWRSLLGASRNGILAKSWMVKNTPIFTCTCSICHTSSSLLHTCCI